MESNKKIGFFQKLYLIITDFRIYPLINKERFSFSFSYFIKLLLLVSFVLAMIISVNLFDLFDLVINNYSSIPEFTFINGELNTENEILIEDNKSAIIIDTKRSAKDYLDGELGQQLNSYESYIIVDKNQIYIYDGLKGNYYSFKDFGVTITKGNLLDFLLYLKSNLYIKILIFLPLFLGVFIGYFVIKIINVFMLAIFAWLINAVFRADLKYSNYFKISMAILTLPIIVEFIAITATGGIPDYAYITYHLLSCVYLFYALRAIKLDYILTNIPGDNLKEKLKKMIEQVASEIEEKNKESSEDEKNEESREEKKQEKDNDEEKK
jgi:hypothetical protein